MAELKKELQKFKEMAKDQRPLVIDPDLVALFLDLGEKNYGALILAIIVQRISHLAAKTKPLNLEMQDYFDLFPFVDPRYLRKSVYALRKYGIWKNRPYQPRSGKPAYTNIRISFKAVARLAGKVQEKQSQEKLKAMYQKINKT